jgi:hypothetical protein
LAFALNPAQRFFRSARGRDCFLLTVCSIATNPNTRVIADLEAVTLQKGEQAGGFGEAANKSRGGAE